MIVQKINVGEVAGADDAVATIRALLQECVEGVSDRERWLESGRLMSKIVTERFAKARRQLAGAEPKIRKRPVRPDGAGLEAALAKLGLTKPEAASKICPRLNLELRKSWSRNRLSLSQRLQRALR